MPDGDLASIVLEAARKERAKQDAGEVSAFENGHVQPGNSLRHDDGYKGKGKGKARENGDARTSHKQGNGHLEPPREFPGYNRTVTASPEPLTPEATRTELDQAQQDNHEKPQTNGAGAQKQPALADKDKDTPQEQFKRPARKRPAVLAGPSARKLSSAFFGGHGHASGTGSGSSSKANKQAARRQYTSESSTDYDDAFGTSDHNNEFRDFFSANGHVQQPHSGTSNARQQPSTNATGDSQDTSNTRSNESSKGNDQEKLGKPGQTSSGSGPMRGPFSRVDSSRGQSLLTRRQSIGSHEAHDKAQQHQDPSQLRTSGPSRRYSVSGAAQRFNHALGAFGHPNELDGSGEEDSQDEGRQSPNRFKSHTPGVNDRHAQWRETSQDEGLRTEQHDKANGLSNARPQGVSRKSSFRSLNNFFKRSQGPGAGAEREQADGEANLSDGQRHPGLSRSNTQGDGHQAGVGKKRWAQLKQKLKQEKKPAELDKTLNGSELINDLSLGLISVMMLKMAFDRDEHDQRRIPVLLNYLKLRITDSVYPFHQSHAIFRIELEYGDGLLKWVIYRELRDFVNLHTHYRVANVTHSLDHFPPFPKVSIPYFNILRKESKEKGRRAPSKAEFARMQREGLENYLLQLVRAVVSFGELSHW